MVCTGRICCNNGGYEMKRLIALAFALCVVVSLAGCGVSINDILSSFTAPPSSSAAAEAQDLYAASQDSAEDGRGEYEGERDAGGLRSGYGVWVYENFRYEGYWENGMPNGEGTLYESVTPGNEPGMHYAVQTITEGNWVDGFADGEIVHTFCMEDGQNHTWGFPVAMGYPAGALVVYTADGLTDLTLAADSLFGVPPWAYQTPQADDAEPELYYVSFGEPELYPPPKDSERNALGEGWYAPGETVTVYPRQAMFKIFAGWETTSPDVRIIRGQDDIGTFTMPAHDVVVIEHYTTTQP